MTQKTHYKTLFQEAGEALRQAALNIRKARQSMYALNGNGIGDFDKNYYDFTGLLGDAEHVVYTLQFKMYEYAEEAKNVD